VSHSVTPNEYKSPKRRGIFFLRTISKECVQNPPRLPRRFADNPFLLYPYLAHVCLPSACFVHAVPFFACSLFATLLELICRNRKRILTTSSIYRPTETQKFGPVSAFHVLARVPVFETKIHKSFVLSHRLRHGIQMRPFDVTSSP
jgi:hypothetical protein